MKEQLMRLGGPDKDGFFTMPPEDVAEIVRLVEEHERTVGTVDSQTGRVTYG